MSIFITGIESFLGKFLAKSLIKRKFVFSGIDLLSQNDFAIKYDINDHNLKDVIPDDCGTIVHLAAISSSQDFKTDVKQAYVTNINGTINIVKAAIEKNVKQIIFASTEWVYGEDKSGQKNESSHIYFENLGSEYALSKAICENILKYYCSLNNINCTILRLGITYGPRQNKNNWSAVESILYDLFLGNTKITIGSKKTARKFIYVEDVSEGIIASMGMKGVKILNLTGDKLITLNEIIETGCKILNVKCKILEKDSNNFNVRDVDNNLVKNLTEWTPKYDFYSGVKNTIQSFKKLDKNIKLSTYKTPGSFRMDHAANDKKRILIIGSQGYLGTRLGNHLTSKKYICSGIDTGFFRKGMLVDEINFPTINMDARKIEKKDIEKYDVVIMLAAISNDPFGKLKPKKIYEPTREYALAIANICKKIGIKFIFSSTCSVYGISSDYLDENATVAPQTPYSLNKYQIETDLKKISDSNFSPIVLRLATIFGISPRMRFDIIINMLCGQAVTENKVILDSNGQAWRPHLHIEDACEAFRCCIESEFKKNGIIILNVGRNDNNKKIIDVANLVLKYSNKCKLEFNFKNNNKNSYTQHKGIQKGEDKRTYRVNFNKINEILPNFRCKWSLHEGIEDFLCGLKKIKLTKIKFNKRDFYRQQQLKYLLVNNQVDQDLYWKKFS